MDNEKALLKRYAQGDEEAFEALLKLYIQPLYGFIFSFVKNKESAEDILQETYIKAWKHFSRFDQEKSFKTWIFTVAKNTTFDVLKKKSAIPFSFFTDEAGESFLENIPDEQELAQATLENEEAGQALQGVIERLPERYRQVLRLFYQEGFSLGEISQVLGEPYNTVKSWHYRGITLLRKEFKNAPNQES